jgi:uncharacterized protein (DUF488 family)
VADKIPVATIGFTQSTAKHFFERLRQAQVRTVIDVRLHNTSQLAGFAKADDLAYFLRTVAGIGYSHLSILAPTDNMLKTYKKRKGDWSTYEREFRDLMAQRKIEDQLTPELLRGTCLLCSEAKPHHCHRRLVCDYLNERWEGILAVRHL